MDLQAGFHLGWEYEAMQNIMLEISYDGTRYAGFQIQNNASSVQGELERALGVIYKRFVRITGAGRTDAGVHARGQVANYTASLAIPVVNLPAALNSLLPGDIVVTKAAEVAADFHARFQACRKIYSYTIDRADYPQVMKRLYSYHLPGPLNLAGMLDGTRLLEGSHDFAAFQASGSRVRDTVRTLYRVELDDRENQKLLVIKYEGDGFLYRMARLLTGSLIRIGQAKLTPADLDRALNGSSPTAVGPPAPPHGLCLEQVFFHQS
jgi:tRNA pseudouridine38-40 synthase